MNRQGMKPSQVAHEMRAKVRQSKIVALHGRLDQLQREIANARHEIIHGVTGRKVKPVRK